VFVTSEFVTSPEDISSEPQTSSLSANPTKTVLAAKTRKIASVKMDSVVLRSGSAMIQVTAKSCQNAKARTARVQVTHVSSSVIPQKTARESLVRHTWDLSANARTVSVLLNLNPRSVEMSMTLTRVCLKVCVKLISPVPVPRATVPSPGGCLMRSQN